MKKIFNKLFSYLPIIVLIIVSGYSILFLFFARYYGFHWNNDGLVTDVFVDSIPIELDDVILSINSLSFEEFLNDPYSEILADQPKGAYVTFEIMRDGEIFSFPIQAKEFIREDFQSRSMNMYLIGILFWAIGTICFSALRPKNIDWRILVSVCFLTAIWMTTGSMSFYRIAYSGIIFRIAFWLSIPSYILIHWMIGNHSKDIPRKISAGIFIPFIFLSVLQAFQLIGAFAYSNGMLLAIVGSLGILFYKFVRYKKLRNDVLFIVMIWGLILLPQIFISTVLQLEDFPSFGISLLLLPLLPLGYMNVLFKRETGKFRFRKNPIIATYLFFSILLILISILVGILLSIFDITTTLALILLFSILVIAIASTFLYFPFIRWVSSKFLGTIYPIDNVINIYSEQISQQETIDDLKELIQNNLTKDLLIDLSWIALVSDFKSNYSPRHLTSDKSLPSKAELMALNANAPIEEPFNYNPKFQWVRLIIPIRSINTFYGWWLIGEHSPDDVFSFDLIETLEVISIQIAMKISTIFQTQHIQSMYQIRVTREDSQESYILRELHDTVLNEFALLKEEIESKGLSDPKINRSFETITSSIRDTIAGLRPPLQEYPLFNSIEDYCFQINQSKKIPINNNIQFDSTDAFEYDEKGKINIYRMIQQGINNALAHSNATEITLYGRLDEESILIEICDNGDGFSLGINFDSIDSVTVNELIQKKHFGIAGMYERAKLIGATFDIESEPSIGTTIMIEWLKDKNNDVKVLDI